MLKKRVIPVLLLKNKRMVKGKKFSKYRDTGDPVSQAKIYNAHNSDELVFLDIEATSLNKTISIELIRNIAKECFMPLSVGGGISKLEHIRELISVGADKVIINSASINNQTLIKEASKCFGKQAIIVSIDVKKEDDVYVIYSNSGTKREDIDLITHIVEMEKSGAGEFLINSIDNDGMMNGYDIDLLNLIKEYSSIPIIISGGAGNFEDLYEGLVNGAHATACASLFHFGDNNPTRARSFLYNKKIPMKNLKAIKF